jgi:hypothetical protein
LLSNWMHSDGLAVVVEFGVPAVIERLPHTREFYRSVIAERIPGSAAISARTPT